MDAPHPNSKFRYDQQVRVIGGPMAGSVGTADRFICSKHGVESVRVHFVPVGIFRYFSESELTAASTKPWQAPEWLLMIADRGETHIYRYGKPHETELSWYVTDKEPQFAPSGNMNSVDGRTYDYLVRVFAATFREPFTPPPGVQKLRITR